MKEYKHELSVRHADSDGFYTEYDEADRVTYSRDKWGFFAFLFYHSDPTKRVAYHVVHKYTRLYNPEFA